MQNGRMEASSLPDKSSFLHIVVRQLGLGDNDPFLEQQWVNRLRRIGLVSMLLFFVWVGTRLPRRSGDRQGSLRDVAISIIQGDFDCAMEREIVYRVSS